MAQWRGFLAVFAARNDTRVGYKSYYVYMMTNRWKNVLYTGVTNSLERRVWEHKNGTCGGFTKQYNCDRLVYFEEFDEIDQAIDREKQIKGLVALEEGRADRETES